jgi:hypothetical protein
MSVKPLKTNKYFKQEAPFPTDKMHSVYTLLPLPVNEVIDMLMLCFG